MDYSEDGCSKECINCTVEMFSRPARHVILSRSELSPECEIRLFHPFRARGQARCAATPSPSVSRGPKVLLSPQLRAVIIPWQISRRCRWVESLERGPLDGNIDREKW